MTVLDASVRYLSTLSPASRRQRQSLLAEFIKPLDSTAELADLYAGEVRNLRDRMLLDRFKPVTVNNALSAFRGLAKAAAQAGDLSMDKFFELTSVPGLSMPSGRAKIRKNHPDAERIVRACWGTNTALGDRDAFVCAAFVGDGLSAGEILRLKPGDIELPSGTLRTGHERTRLLEITTTALERWMKTRGDSGGPIITPSRGSRSNRSSPAQLVYDIVKRGAALAGIPSPVTRAGPGAENNIVP